MGQRQIRRSVNKRLAAVLLAGRGFDLMNLERAVAIWPSERLIYNRLKKSGNTRIVAFLNDQLAGGEFESARQLKAALLRPFDLPLGDLARLDRFYSFTIVRNPYARVLSAFLDKIAHPREPRRERSAGYAAYPGYGEVSPEGFARFLEFLDAGGLKADRHWWPQADLLYQPAERFSFIGRLETMAADMGRVLEAIGRDPAAARALDHRHELEADRRETRTAEREAAFYTPRGRAIVARLHARDFALFSYPT